jgi:hypothetical protein
MDKLDKSVGNMRRKTGLPDKWIAPETTCPVIRLIGHYRDLQEIIQGQLL